MNVLCVKKEKIYPANVLEHNLKGEKRVIFAVIPNGEEWH